jgi:hypothetical protein
VGSIHKRTRVCLCDSIKRIAATLDKANKESAYTLDAPRFICTAASVTADALL